MNHMEVIKQLVKDSDLSKNEIRVLLAILSFSKNKRSRLNAGTSQNCFKYRNNIFPEPHQIWRKKVIFSEITLRGSAPTN